jgi:hypothetical protein
MGEAGGGEQDAYRVSEDVPQRYYNIEQMRMALEAGWLGGIFGSKERAPTNIAGFFVGILTVTIIIFGFIFVPTHISAMDFLNYLAPLITLVLGYLFGKST